MAQWCKQDGGKMVYFHCRLVNTIAVFLSLSLCCRSLKMWCRTAASYRLVKQIPTKAKSMAKYMPVSHIPGISTDGSKATPSTY